MVRGEGSRSGPRGGDVRPPTEDELRRSIDDQIARIVAMLRQGADKWGNGMLASTVRAEMHAMADRLERGET